MSLDFAQKIGLCKDQLCRLPGLDEVGTAKTGASMRVVGQTIQPLTLRVAGLAKALRFRPVVLDGLDMDLNLSGPFLKENKIDQLHSEDCLLVQGTRVRLHNHPGASGKNAKDKVSTVYTTHEVTVEPYSTADVELRVLGFEKQTMPIGDGCLDGSEVLESRFDIHALRGVLLRPQESRPTVGGQFLNTTESPITIPANVCYGTWSALPKAGPTINHLHAPEIQAEAKKDPETAWLRGPTTKKNYEKRANYVMELFKLKDNPVLADPTELSKAVGNLLKYWGVFGFQGEYGKTELLKHEIHLVPGTKPINVRYRPIPPSLEPSLKRQIDKWIEEDIIEEAQSPWSFALVPAMKKDAAPDERRWCLDFRPLNKVTIKDNISVGDVADNLARLANSRVFSTIDASGAFHQIEMDEASRDYTAFGTPWAQYRFKRMPFGVCNGPAQYRRLMNMAMSGIPSSIALAYLDDVMAHSRTVQEHHKHLALVLAAHEKAGLKLKPSKCRVYQDQVEYLGHLVSEKGLEPVPAYIKDVVDWPVPNTRTKVRAFLGKAGYYRRFIKNYAHIARPLVEVTATAESDLKDDEEFEPSAALRESFEQLKSALTSAPILGHPNFESGEPFVLDTDWSYSNRAIGAVLSQKQDGHERVLMYGSHKLSNAKSNYPSTKGEMYAIIHFVSKWSYYLKYRPFVLRTDHSALRFYYKMECPSGLEQRWLQLLADHDFVVEYRPGDKHGNADALSRAEHAGVNSSPSQEVDDEPADWAPRKIGLPVLCAIQQQLPPGQLLSARVVLEAQLADPDIKDVMLYVKAKQPLPEDFAKGGSVLRRELTTQFHRLSIHKGLLYFWAGQKAKLVLPTALQDDVAVKAHRLVAHRGPKATLQRVRATVFSPGMTKVVELATSACKECQTKTAPTKQKALYEPQVSSYPFQVLSLDFVGPLPRSQAGFQYIFSVRDLFTRWTEFFPTRDMTAKTVIKHLVQDIFPRFGLPEKVHSDQGTQFTSQEFKDAMEALGIVATTTPAYHPQSNPVERSHRDLKAALNALCKDSPSKWPDAIPAVLTAMRNTVNETTGTSPFAALFGRDAPTDIDLFFPFPKEEQELSHLSDYALRLRRQIQQAHQLVQANCRKAILRTRKRYRGSVKPYKVGQQVHLFTPVLKQGQSSKFPCQMWSGPWVITNKVNELVYKIKPDDSWDYDYHEISVSVDRIRPFGDSATKTPHPQQPDEEDNDPEVLPPVAHAPVEVKGELKQEPEQSPPQSPPPLDDDLNPPAYPFFAPPNNDNDGAVPPAHPFLAYNHVPLLPVPAAPAAAPAVIPAAAAAPAVLPAAAAPAAAAEQAEAGAAAEEPEAEEDIEAEAAEAAPEERAEESEESVEPHETPEPSDRAESSDDSDPDQGPDGAQPVAVPEPAPELPDPDEEGVDNENDQSLELLNPFHMARQALDEAHEARLHELDEQLEDQAGQVAQALDAEGQIAQALQQANDEAEEDLEFIEDIDQSLVADSSSSSDAIHMEDLPEMVPPLPPRGPGTPPIPPRRGGRPVNRPVMDEQDRLARRLARDRTRDERDAHRPPAAVRTSPRRPGHRPLQGRGLDRGRAPAPGRGRGAGRGGPAQRGAGHGRPVRGGSVQRREYEELQARRLELDAKAREQARTRAERAERRGDRAK